MGLDLYFITQNTPKHLSQACPEELRPTLEVGYFRKFNALLKWVATHVAPVKNLTEVRLDKTALQNLHDTLEKLTPGNCAQLLPTKDGFFYGSTDYDDYYWECVKELKALTKKLLASVDFDTTALYFKAWW